MMSLRRWAFLVALTLPLAVPATASADIVLLVGQPYGRFGFFSPTGHAAIFLTRVCADGPLTVRMCSPGEPGAVISRYHRVAGRDWLVTPVIPYLYAVDNVSMVPREADRGAVLSLRDAYRRTHLSELIPDGPAGTPPKGDWVQTVGAAYDRVIVALGLPTTEREDRLLVDWLNARDNTARFNLIVRNCADFARDLFNVAYPGALKGRLVADLGITTPKGLARSLVARARESDVPLVSFVVPQIPGSRRRSGRARGIIEGLVTTKKYAVPLLVLEPLVPAGLALGYLTTGRFDPVRHATGEVVSPAEVARIGEPGAGRDPVRRRD